MWFSVENKTDKEVGSVFPQVSCLNQNLSRSIKFDDFVNLDSELLFQLEPKAKLTDVLSQANISAHGLLINKKVKDLLEKFKLMEHRYYKCLVKDNTGITHDYYWLHISDYSVLDKIDYANSKFNLRESGFREKNITLDSFKDYKDKLDFLGILYTVSADELVLSQEFDSSIDLFNIPIFIKKKIIISEKLKTELISQKITGILLDESSILT